MGLELLFLLLPIAALSGWWVGRRGQRARGLGFRSRFQEDYFRGLNYLVNEQPDKAIEVFVRMVEVDSETVDTHFALAGLFRRRGEADRAIRIHQNLMARPTLSEEQRKRALYELARDHHAAGLLDRAEGLYQELSADRDLGEMARRQLLDIYQQERDWKRAIEVAETLRSSREFDVELLLSHYYCETAEQAISQGRIDDAMSALRQAPRKGDGAVRVSLLEGQIALASGKPEEAMRALERVEIEGPEFLPEILGPLQQAYAQRGSDDWLAFLEDLASRHASTSILLALCYEVQRRQGTDAAVQLLRELLAKHPSLVGVGKLIELQSATDAGDEGLRLVAQIAQRVLQAKPRYRCTHCGFSSRTLYWQCPGCKRWGTIKPIYGIEGE